MTTLEEGHPVGYIYRRETLNKQNAWGPIIDRSIEKSKNMLRKNVYAHFGCVNAVEFSEDGQYLVSGGDDRRVLVWDVGKDILGTSALHHGKPTIMQAEHGSNIFALSVSAGNKRIFSAGNDDQVILHDMETGAPLDTFLHEQPVYGVSIDPYNDNIFSSACDDGRLLLYDTREPCSTDPFCIASCRAAFHAVMFHPREPRMVLSGNSKEGVALWDVRWPKSPLMKYGGLNSDQCCMSARFNFDGSKILALRRRLPPVLYATHETTHLFQFHHPGYYNSCTMKSCTFAGSHDQFVLSGSDNFELYMWKTPDENTARWVDEAHLVLRGHRSVVNQVRYNHAYGIVVSSGVEKLIKVWSPFGLNCGRNGGDRSSEKKRRIFSNSEYLDLVTLTGQLTPLTYDNARKSTAEDPRMMAFFDALVQRDIKGLSSDNDTVEENSYTVISPPQSSTSDDSADEPPRAVADRSSSVPLGVPESVASGVAMREEAEGHESEDSDTSDIFNFENIDSLPGILQNDFVADSVPNSPLSSTRQDDEAEEELKILGDSNMTSTVDPESNIIKELIAKKQDRLRKLAEDHVRLETFPKKSARRKRNQLRRLVSSSSEESEDTSRKRSRLHDRAEGPSRTDETDSNEGNGNEGSVSYQFPTPTSSESNTSSQSARAKKKKLQELKKLRYGDEKLTSSKVCSRNCTGVCRSRNRFAHERDKTDSSTSSSDTDVPGPSSKGENSSKKKKRRRCTSRCKSRKKHLKEFSSSSSSSSDTDSDGNVGSSPQPGCSSSIAQRLLSSSSSSSNSSSEDTQDISADHLRVYFEQIKNSPSFKASPLIRRIEYERLRKLKRRQRRIAKNRQRRNNPRGNDSSSSTSSSCSEASDSARPSPPVPQVNSATLNPNYTNYTSHNQPDISSPHANSFVNSTALATRRLETAINGFLTRCNNTDLNTESGDNVQSASDADPVVDEQN